MRLFDGYSYEFGKALNEIVSGRYARRDFGGAADRMLDATEHMFDPSGFLHREVGFVWLRTKAKKALDTDRTIRDTYF